MARSKKYLVKKNGALKNKGLKKEASYKKTIAELERALAKKKGHLRNNKHLCPVISSNLQDKITHLERQLQDTRTQLTAFRKRYKKR